jgi:hypothetical protein
VNVSVESTPTVSVPSAYEYWYWQLPFASHEAWASGRHASDSHPATLYVDDRDGSNTARDSGPPEPSPSVAGSVSAAALSFPWQLTQTRSLPVSVTASICRGGVPRLTDIRYSNDMGTISDTKPPLSAATDLAAPILQEESRERRAAASVRAGGDNAGSWNGDLAESRWMSSTLNPTSSDDDAAKLRCPAARRSAERRSTWSMVAPMAVAFDLLVNKLGRAR